jgi:hypothetical protein
MNFLNDFYAETADANNYDQKIVEWSGKTGCITTHGAEMQFFSYTDALKRPDGKDTFFALLPEYADAFEQGRMIPNCGITLNVPDELKDQMKGTNKLLLMINSEMYLVSEFAIALLNRWAGVTGETAANPSHFLLRNLHMAAAIQSRNPKLKVIFRQEGAVKKVFAVMSGSYTFRPQNVILDVLNMLRGDHTLSVQGANLSHLETSLMAALPREEDEYRELFKASHVELEGGSFRPILEVKTSDIGRSSLIVRSLLEYSDGAATHRVIMDTVPMMHSGAMDLSKVDDTIFANIRKLPETLVELMGRPICDYSKVDLTSEAGCSKNRKALEKVIRYGFKTCADAFGGCTIKKRSLINDLVAERDLTVPYTLYDIAVLFMGIPDRAAGLSESTISILRTDCGKVPYALAKYNAAKTADDDSDVTLLPE